MCEDIDEEMGSDESDMINLEERLADITTDVGRGRERDMINLEERLAPFIPEEQSPAQ